MDKVWLLTEDEFLVLASACGIKSIRFFSLNIGSVESERVIYTIHGLRQKGLLEYGEDLHVTQEIKEIFETISDAYSTLELHKKSGRTCVIYMNDYAVRISKSFRRENTYEVSRMETNEIWSYLQDEGWIFCKEGVRE